MKFSVRKKDFFQVLQKVSNVTPIRSTLPILSCILLTAKNDALNMRSTDLEITMSANCDVDIVEEGSIALPSRMLKDITSELPNTILHFEIDGEGVLITTDEGGEYRITGFPASEFPSEPIIDDSKSVSMEAAKFARLVEKTGFAVSRDEMKVALTGVLFQFSENALCAVATDGHRMVRYTLKEFKGSSEINDIIVHPKFLNLSVSNIKDIDFVTLRIGRNHVMLELKDTTIYSRIIEERFPDYESVIPASNDKEIVIDIDLLLSAVKRVGLFASRNTRQIGLHFKENSALMTAEDMETSSKAREIIDVEYSGEEFSIGYNSDYLREVIRHIDGDKVRMKLKDPLSAGLFFPTEQLDEEDILFLLMPIRLL